MSDPRAKLEAMDAALAMTEIDAPRPHAVLAGYAPPSVELPPFTRDELETLLRGGEPEADACEQFLASATRVRGCLDLALAEGLAALRQGDRLAELGCHLDDYAREALDLGKRTAESLARLGAELRTRPLLREALRSGRVRLRAAETVLPLAVGEAEALWVERAGAQTVRELEAAVRAARAPQEDPDEEWVELRTHLPRDERLVLDEALAVAREQMPGTTRVEQLEALAQEYLAEFSTDGDGDVTRPLGPGFRPRGPGPARRSAAGTEPGEWAELSGVPELVAPDVRFDESTTAGEIDARLRELGSLRAGWDRLIGWCGHGVKRSGMHLLLGYGSFRQYVEERLGLPARAVEQRVALEARLAGSPALQEARGQGVSYDNQRPVRVPPPALHPRRLPRGPRAGAGLADVAAGRGDLDGTAGQPRRDPGLLNARVGDGQGEVFACSRRRWDDARADWFES